VYAEVRELVLALSHLSVHQGVQSLGRWLVVVLDCALILRYLLGRLGLCSRQSTRRVCSYVDLPLFDLLLAPIVQFEYAYNVVHVALDTVVMLDAFIFLAGWELHIGQNELKIAVMELARLLDACADAVNLRAYGAGLELES
jgi:hypothetical protein